MATEKINAWFRLASPPPSGRSAIAVIDLCGDVEGALRRLEIRSVASGSVALRDLGGVDRGVVARWSEGHASLMPHAGPMVVEMLLRRMAEAGLSEATEEGAGAERGGAYPEARSVIEARMLGALARAASPLAVDLLLDQPRRWAGREPSEEVAGRSAVLNRLIDPPLVVTMGRPNIGKSTLLNALAGRSVALVYDEPGTTRDHVGVSLELAGLVVRWIDTPGMGGGLTAAAGTERAEIERQSNELAMQAARRADLLVLCADAEQGFLEPPGGTRAVLRVGLRRDLGAAAGAEVSVSAADGGNLAELVRRVRDALVPPEAIGSPGPWKFWM